ncbi:MAG TPA: recombinase RecT, partial [Bacilli bacterium]|nr:recombinase RecT [Bacilli bacterium]
MANIIKNPKASEIAAMKPGEMVSAESTAERFVQLFNKVLGTEKGANIYEQERFHFMKLIQEKNDLQQCDTISLYGCFLDTAVDGLSLDPSRKLTYIIPENVNVGTKDSPKWIKRARRVISPYGELALRQKYGQIKYADDPVIVYAGDKFS